MNEIEAFVHAQAQRHPEMRRMVKWSDAKTIAAREGVHVRIQRMSRPGRLIGADGAWEIQLSDQLSEAQRAFTCVHELVHYWRDREEGSTFYSSMEWEPEPTEDFANFVAWYCTSAAHEYYARSLYDDKEE